MEGCKEDAKGCDVLRVMFILAGISARVIVDPMLSLDTAMFMVSNNSSIVGVGNVFSSASNVLLSMAALSLLSSLCPRC